MTIPSRETVDVFRIVGLENYTHFVSTNLSQKDSPDSLIKKKALCAVVRKGLLVTVFLDMKVSVTFALLEKDATVNSAFCCQFFRQNPP